VLERIGDRRARSGVVEALLRRRKLARSIGCTTATSVGDSNGTLAVRRPESQS